MIIDVTGVELIPGNFGRNCPRNGKHFDKNGIRIECCCDECDYMMCCFEMCEDCTDYGCPNAKNYY